MSKKWAFASVGEQLPLRIGYAHRQVAKPAHYTLLLLDGGAVEKIVDLGPVSPSFRV